MICLILGAGNSQLELIRRSKSRGFFTIVVSPFDGDPGTSIADVHLKEDVRDIKAILRHAARYHPDICIADQSDVGALAQAVICAELGLPCTSVSTIESFCDKHKCYQAIERAGLRFHPSTHYFSSLKTATKFLTDSSAGSQSWIVKPINSQGSKGVSRLGSTNDQEFLYAALNESAGAGFILQKFIEGRHFSVDAVVSQGQYKTLVVAEKTKYQYNGNLDKRLVITGENHELAEQSVVDFHHEVVHTLSLDLGLTHGEYVLSSGDGQIYLIDIAARGGGGNISGKIVKYITGFDPLDFIIDCGLGVPPRIEVDEQSDRCAVLHFFDTNGENIIYSDVDCMPYLLHLEHRADAGIGPPKDSRSRPGYFIVKGESLDEALLNERLFLRSLEQ